ncbi:uncharacterized protein LOC129591531 isoform X2 [Paramacrobiotus metropolitanus]|uniref:uncharacterized protein LOC129591531 isoform X2 n=1 Tax=Paramacrobiotus metropolitanus TaxID=2943436 RepID=UPI002445E421|nr:uncharacterized protein LOC129591531 isoform X2 [Paramacrobiotus metropolitanus]
MAGEPGRRKRHHSATSSDDIIFDAASLKKPAHAFSPTSKSSRINSKSGSGYGRQKLSRTLFDLEEDLAIIKFVATNDNVGGEKHTGVNFARELCRKYPKIGKRHTLTSITSRLVLIRKNINNYDVPTEYKYALTKDAVYEVMQKDKNKRNNKAGKIQQKNTQPTTYRRPTGSDAEETQTLRKKPDDSKSKRRRIYEFASDSDDEDTATVIREDDCASENKNRRPDTAASVIQISQVSESRLSVLHKTLSPGNRKTSAEQIRDKVDTHKARHSRRRLSSSETDSTGEAAADSSSVFDRKSPENVPDAVAVNRQANYYVSRNGRNNVVSRASSEEIPETPCRINNIETDPEAQTFSSVESQSNRSSEHRSPSSLEIPLQPPSLEIPVLQQFPAETDASPEHRSPSSLEIAVLLPFPAETDAGCRAVEPKVIRHDKGCQTAAIKVAQSDQASQATYIYFLQPQPGVCATNVPTTDRACQTVQSYYFMRENCCQTMTLMDDGYVQKVIERVDRGSSPVRFPEDEEEESSAIRTTVLYQIFSERGLNDCPDTSTPVFPIRTKKATLKRNRSEYLELSVGRSPINPKPSVVGDVLQPSPEEPFRPARRIRLTSPEPDPELYDLHVDKPPSVDNSPRIQTPETPNFAFQLLPSREEFNRAPLSPTHAQMEVDDGILDGAEDFEVQVDDASGNDLAEEIPIVNTTPDVHMEVDSRPDSVEPFHMQADDAAEKDVAGQVSAVNISRDSDVPVRVKTRNECVEDVGDDVEFFSAKSTQSTGATVFESIPATQESASSARTLFLGSESSTPPEDGLGSNKLEGDARMIAQLAEQHGVTPKELLYAVMTANGSLTNAMAWIVQKCAAGSSADSVSSASFVLDRALLEDHVENVMDGPMGRARSPETLKRRASFLNGNRETIETDLSKEGTTMVDALKALHACRPDFSPQD